MVVIESGEVFDGRLCGGARLQIGRKHLRGGAGLICGVGLIVAPANHPADSQHQTDYQRRAVVVPPALKPVRLFFIG